MKFKDAPIGARFKYPEDDTIWIKLSLSGRGLVCQWNGNVKGNQSFCCFSDEENGIDFNTEIELI